MWNSEYGDSWNYLEYRRFPSTYYQRPSPRKSDYQINPQDVDRIIIRHPAHNDLLSFCAWDHGSGIHLGTVLLACWLVACNEFDSFLTRDRNGFQRITDPDDSLLPHGLYFFHVRPPQPDIYKYPIYSCFKDWTYPHEKEPNLSSARCCRS
jgi:hypothetical protein